jgi:hypothetical protein
VSATATFPTPECALQDTHELANMQVTGVLLAGLLKKEAHSAQL